VIPFFEVLKLAKNWLRLMPGIASFHGGPMRNTSGRRGGLDPNHLGAVVGEILGRDRPNPDPGEVENVNSSSAKRVISNSPG